MTNPVSVARLFEVFDLRDGALYRKFRAGKVLAGDRAGTVQGGGYRLVMLDTVRFKEHRVIWAMTHGRWPGEGMVIDHIDGDPANNHPANLREVSQQVNTQNRRRVRCVSKAGSRVPGVYRRRGKYHVRLTVDGTSVPLGSFGTLGEAERVAIQGRRKLYAGNTL